MSVLFFGGYLFLAQSLASLSSPLLFLGKKNGSPRVLLSESHSAFSLWRLQSPGINGLAFSIDDAECDAIL